MSKCYSYIKNVHWVPSPNRLEMFLSPTADFPLDKVASVFTFCRTADDAYIFGCKPNGRIILPGGGRDPHETLEQAAAREALEETGAILHNVRIVGWYKVRVDAPMPEENRRPWPEFYEVYCMADVSGFSEAPLEHETCERMVMPYAQAVELEPIQYQFSRIFLEESRRKAV